MKLLAVYGTLKRDRALHSLLGDAKMLGTCTIWGIMYMDQDLPRLFHATSDDMDSPFREELARDHEIEIYSIDEKEYRGLVGLEVGAGYGIEYISTPFGYATVFISPEDSYYKSFVHVENY